MTIEGQLETKTWSVVAGNIMEVISKIGSDEEKGSIIHLESQQGRLILTITIIFIIKAAIERANEISEH